MGRKGIPIRLAGLLFCLLLVLGEVAAQPSPAPLQQPALTGYDVRRYLGTPAWELAQAVKHQRTDFIRRLITQSPALLHYQEPQAGMSLLQFAVFNRLFEAVQALVEAGANPNLPDTYHGASPMSEAASDYDSSQLLRLLLAHGGNPNLEVLPRDGSLNSSTVLLKASATNLSNTQLLVEAGANINYVTPRGHECALGVAMVQNRLEVVRYLLVDKGADFRRVLLTTISGKPLYIADLLKRITPKVGSSQWQTKQEIIRYLERNGIDYRAAPVPKHLQQQFSQEYLNTY